MITKLFLHLFSKTAIIYEILNILLHFAHYFVYKLRFNYV